MTQLTNANPALLSLTEIASDAHARIQQDRSTQGNIRSK